MTVASFDRVGMRHMEPKLTIRKSSEIPMVEKTEVSGVDDCVCSNMANQRVDYSEPAVGIANQQKSHAYNSSIILKGCASLDDQNNLFHADNLRIPCESVSFSLCRHIRRLGGARVLRKI
jgi:hypothetical protein